MLNWGVVEPGSKQVKPFSSNDRKSAEFGLKDRKLAEFD